MMCVSVVTCPPIPQSRSMTVSCPRVLVYGALCNFACEAGYRLVGVHEVRCERGDETSASGKWSSGPPKCVGE